MSGILSSPYAAAEAAARGRSKSSGKCLRQLSTGSGVNPPSAQSEASVMVVQRSSSSSIFATASWPAANIELLEDLCTTMTDASLCALGGLTPLPVLSCLKHFPEDFDRPRAAASAAA